MNATDAMHWGVELAAGAVLTVPPGATLGCRTGSVWLTEHRPGRDVLLAAGEAHTVGGTGPAVVTARGDARLVVGLACDSAGRGGLGEFWARLRQRGERVGTGLHHRPGLPTR